MKVIYSLMLLVTLILNNPFKAESMMELFGVLSDCFFSVGVVIISAAALSYAAGQGVFALAGYTIKRIPSVFLKEKGESYYTYLSQKKVNKDWLSPICVGLSFVFVGLLFLGLWYCFAA